MKRQPEKVITLNTKRKIFLLIIAAVVVIAAAIAISATVYFSPKTFLSGVEPSDVKSISVFDGSTGIGFDIGDEAEIRYIVENIQSIETNRGKISLGYTGYSFRMYFYGENGNEIDSFIINSDSTIRKDPFFYSCSGGLCFDYLKELEESYAK